MGMQDVGRADAADAAAAEAAEQCTRETLCLREEGR